MAKSEKGASCQKLIIVIKMKTAPSEDTPMTKKRRKKADICSDKPFETTVENPNWRDKKLRLI